MRIIPAALIAVAVSAPLVTAASAASPIEGLWSGRGQVKLTSGQVEPVSCRVSYEESTGRTFVLHATCATTAGTFVQSGRVVQLSASSYTGRLYSEQYSVSGNVSISVSGSKQTIRVSSPKGTGSLSLSKR